mgnify:CR=1 FL=1
MERADGQVADCAVFVQLSGEPFAHFTGCFIGKGDGRELPRGYLLFTQQMNGAGNQRFRFSGAWAGDNSHSGFDGADGFLLLRIQLAVSGLYRRGSFAPDDFWGASVFRGCVQKLRDAARRN